MVLDIVGIVTAPDTVRVMIFSTVSMVTMSVDHWLKPLPEKVVVGVISVVAVTSNRIVESG